MALNLDVRALSRHLTHLYECQLHWQRGCQINGIAASTYNLTDLRKRLRLLRRACAIRAALRGLAVPRCDGGISARTARFSKSRPPVLGSTGGLS
jgi:hypothetical protein